MSASDPFLDAINSAAPSPSKLVRVARAMRASDRWADAMQFERGYHWSTPDRLEPVSGEFEAR